MTLELLTELAKAKAIFQQRTIIEAMGIRRSDMTAGYCDGLGDTREVLPNNSNYSPSYIHGWNNGRDDRIKKPRSSYSALKKEADTLLRGEL